MSGPVVPPLEVTEVDGSPDGRPITKIIVSNGDLSISGREATIDTSGSATVPGTPAKAVQFNSDPAGTFTGSSQLLYETATNAGRIEMSSGAVATQPEIRTMTGRGLLLSSTDADESIRNQIVVFGENDAPDGIALFPDTGLYVQVGDSSSTPAQITSRGATANMVLTTNLTEDKAKITLTAGADGDVLVQTDNAGVLQLENTTTDADSVLSIMGNGTGDAKLDLQNASERVWVMMDENKKLKIMGGTGGNTFIIDVSGAATGITFPDGTTQTTAASGGGGIGIVYPPVSNSQSTALMHFSNISAPFGTSSQTTQSFNTDSPIFVPIIARRTATFTDICCVVTSGVGSTSYVDLGLYSDNAGQPGTLLGQGTVDVDTTGTQTAALVAEAGQSLTSTAGTQFWLSMVRQAGVGTFTMQAGNKSDVPMWAWTAYATSYGILVQSGSDNTLPATAAFTTGYAWNILALGIDYE